MYAGARCFYDKQFPDSMSSCTIICGRNSYADWPRFTGVDLGSFRGWKISCTMLWSYSKWNWHRLLPFVGFQHLAVLCSSPSPLLISFLCLPILLSVLWHQYSILGSVHIFGSRYCKSWNYSLVYLDDISGPREEGQGEGCEKWSPSVNTAFW